VVHRDDAEFSFGSSVGAQENVPCISPDVAAFGSEAIAVQEPSVEYDEPRKDLGVLNDI
jgi:hypothetical protein